MRILLLRHYPLLEGSSMRSFSDQVSAGLRDKGHFVRELTASVCLARLAGSHRGLRKWLSYLDQFVLFPPLLWLRALTLPSGSLCVVADQSLGPWIPWIKHQPHVVHVHDLLALEGSLGKQPFHRVPWSGRLYQRWIRHGFRQARCFLSVSTASQLALSKQLLDHPQLSEVLYNPLSERFVPLSSDAVDAEVNHSLPKLGSLPFLLHIGRNWYKNRLGVLLIWEKLRGQGADVHLVLVGSLEASLVAWIQQRPSLQQSLHVLSQARDQLVVALYNRAEALLFPSHAEGFGWPILEAMACGCPVLTTDRPPMTEVAGDAATLIPPFPVQGRDQDGWADQAARRVQSVLQRSAAERQRARERGLLQAGRFQHSHWLDQLEAHYLRALELQEPA